MPYVEAVLLECQRVFPVVPTAGPRRVLKTADLDNYLIPKVGEMFPELLNFTNITTF